MNAEPTSGDLCPKFGTTSALIGRRPETIAFSLRRKTKGLVYEIGLYGQRSGRLQRKGSQLVSESLSGGRFALTGA